MRDRSAGRKSQAIGAAFESWIEGQHIHAHRLGILAFVEKTEAHAKTIQGRLMFVGKGVADYIGCLVGGRCLAVEAKSTGDEYLMRSAITPKQVRHLDAVAMAGGLALLLVEFRLTVHQSYSSRAGYAIPWTEVPWKVRRFAESVSVNDVQQWKIEPETCYLSRWHAGGPVVGSVGAVGGRQRVLPRE